MNETQRSAYIIAQAACMNAEVAAMQAENMRRQQEDLDITYIEEDFRRLIDKYGLGHNTVIQFLRD